MSYKSNFIWLVTLPCIILLLAACQSTPEDQFVVNKAARSLDDLVLEKADPNETRAQTEDSIAWSETKTVDSEIENLGEYTVTVTIDAETPKAPSQVPVYLIEPQEFSIEFLKKAANYLMAGEIYDGKTSKQDVMMELLSCKKEISTHSIMDEYQDQADEWLEYFNEKYESAPESNSEAKFEFDDSEYGIRELHLKSYLNDNSIMDFSSYGLPVNSFFFRINEFMRVFQYLNNSSGENTQANGTETTYEQALKTAGEALMMLFDEPYAMMRSDITDKINYLEYLWNDGEEISLSQAYVFYYTREYDGISSLLIDPVSTVSTDETEYAKPYTREYALIVVDDRGIAIMNYESFSNTIEKLNENVQIMPFTEVLERFKSDVFYHNLWGLSNTEITITQIEFGMVREPVKNDPDRYMMVPAWNFIGSINNGLFVEQDKSILALSALNGSVITDYQSIVAPK